MAPVTAWQVENMFSQSFRVQSSCLVIWSYSFEFSIKLGHNPIFEWARKTRSKTETAHKIQMQVQNLGSYTPPEIRLSKPQLTNKLPYKNDQFKVSQTSIPQMFIAIASNGFGACLKGELI